jgi:hypothetical protein
MYYVSFSYLTSSQGFICSYNTFVIALMKGTFDTTIIFNLICTFNIEYFNLVRNNAFAAYCIITIGSSGRVTRDRIYQKFHSSLAHVTHYDDRNLRHFVGHGALETKSQIILEN